MTPTLFSVSYAGLWSQHSLDIEGFIRKAAALGYPAVELMAKRPHLSVLDIDDAAIARIKACTQENNIEIATLAGYTDFTTVGSKATSPTKCVRPCAAAAAKPTSTRRRRQV